MIQKQTVYLSVKIEDSFTFLITKEISNYLNGNCSIDFYNDGRCIYTPCFITQTTKESKELEHLIIERLDKKEGYFFTPEQLNEYTANVIKQALETAAERVTLEHKEYQVNGEHISQNIGQEVCIDSEEPYKNYVSCDKQSIINTSEETFNKFFIP